ncbi:pentapeptide repeat-containing protein [Dictyobacter kobayashii]|uniref:Pentapeptide repeat-containing protein n=1 Tax=Dictyobacter kobayashii TaxID=2014872 RepID=A0A402AW91_9CHLR|nr:pentapeptide repeat-containing protein [Dictyobacter kobayashii]GCE23293.1 hypothetical protein KDK_70930 [Dictyobacter kobayashii]
MSDVTEPVHPLQEGPLYPAGHDRDAWLAYWKARGQHWRSEPEIDAGRQHYLSQCMAVVPDIAQGIYPFKGISLSRADLEWLLAGHEDGRGPVDWDDEQQRGREGLDMRGVNLSRLNLRALPLARLRAALTWDEWTGATTAQRIEAQAHLEYCDLSHAHLEGAVLNRVQLQHARLTNASLVKADLSEAQLQNAQLSRAQLQGADLRKARLTGAVLREVQARQADLSEAVLQGCDLSKADLQQANLRKILAQQADFSLAHLEQAYLHDAHLQEANLRGTHLEDVDMTLAFLTGSSLRQAYLQRAYIRGAHLERADLYRVHLEAADLSRAHLEGAFLQGAFFDRFTCLDDVQLGSAQIGCASLADIHWDYVNLAGIHWDAISRIGEERHGGEVISSRRAAKSLSRPGQSRVRKAVRTYRQLAAVLRSQGLYEEAGRFSYRALVLQRVVFRLQARQRQVRFDVRLQCWGAWFGSWFLDLLAGYGYRLGRSILFYLVCIIFFALLYLLPALPLAAIHPATWLDALLTSLSSFHGRTLFSVHLPAGHLFAFISALETILGFFYTIILVALLTRRLLHR